MKKYDGNIKKCLPAGRDGGGESYADRIPEMAPSTKREGGSPLSRHFRKSFSTIDHSHDQSAHWKNTRIAN